jgi:hypothetical protein
MAVRSRNMERIIRKATEIKLHPNNMKERGKGFS